VYDPHGVITTIRPVYKHMPNILVEITANLESWEDLKQIIEVEAQKSNYHLVNGPIQCNSDSS
jgi:hypothetical protein